MKNKMKFLGIVALVGFAMFGCDDGNTPPDNGTTPGNDTTPNPCANGHAFPEWIAPTCEIAGNSERECTRCEAPDTRTEGFAAPGHYWKYLQDASLVMPTCEEGGYGTRECQRDECGKKETDVPFDKLGHDWDFGEDEPWDEIKIPNCSELGEEQRTCGRCDKTEERELQKDLDEHAIEVVSGKAPTCFVDGYGTIKCTRCSFEKTGDLLPAPGEHHFVEHWELLTPATCTATGTDERFCTRNCGEDGDWETKTTNSLGGHIVTITEWKALSTQCEREKCSDYVGLAEYIQKSMHSGTTAANAVHLKISINLGTMGTAANDWTQLLAALESGGKLVALDLSGSTRSSTGAFTTGSASSTAAPGLAGLNRIVSLVLPSATVTSIDVNAFMSCVNLTSITIPNSVTSIGGAAFQNCSSLTSVTIPNSVTSIGTRTFFDCSGLTSIVIPDTVNTIGSNAFQNCTNLQSITLPLVGTSANTTTYFGALFGANSQTNQTTAVDTHKSLKTVVITRSGNNTIPDYAFQNWTSLTSITIPNSVTSIGRSAFQDCSGLTSINIPNSVTSIGWYAFQGCTGLTSVGGTGSGASINIPSSVTNIDSEAFRDCTGLTNIVIPDTVNTIGGDVFRNCTNTQSITLPLVGATAGTTRTLGSLFYSSSASASLKTVVITRSGDNTIPNGAFNGWRNLTSITIPAGITSIGNTAFWNCTGLTSITIPASVTSIGNQAFQGCTGLTSINIPNNVTSIGENAFQGCTGLTSIGGTGSGASINIPNNVTSIGRGAFRDCTGLTNIVIPDTVDTIGNEAFQNCTNLQSITLPLVGATANTTRFFGQLFGAIGSLSQSTTADTHASLKTVVITRSGDNTITASAFRDWSSLTSVTIGNSVTSIGSNAFQDCTGLTSIIIPNSVTSISAYAFQNCTGLTSVTIPNSVTSIGLQAFDGCTNLTSVTFQRAGTTISNDNSFPNGASLRTAYAAGGIGTYTRPNTTSTTWTKQ